MIDSRTKLPLPQKCKEEKREGNSLSRLYSEKSSLRLSNTNPTRKLDETVISRKDRRIIRSTTKKSRILSRRERRTKHFSSSLFASLSFFFTRSNRCYYAYVTHIVLMNRICIRVRVMNTQAFALFPPSPFTHLVIVK